MTSSDYNSYLLRLWQVNENEHPVWRIMLENVQTGEKRGFTSPKELLAYLSQMTTEEKLTVSERGQTEV